MKLGIGSYTFGWAVGVNGYPPAVPMDEMCLLQKARELGVSLVQVGDNLPLHTFDPGRLQRFADSARDLGIQIEIGARRLTLERLTTYIDLAKKTNCSLLRFVIDDSDYHPDDDEIRAILRAAVPLLGDCALAIENHDRFKAGALRDMIASAGSDRIGVCLDTANSLGAGEGIDAVAEILGPYVLNLHVKDFHIERVPWLMGFTVQGRPAGHGFLNVASLLFQLGRYPRCQTAILELWTPLQSSLAQTIQMEQEWAAQSIRFLRPLFN